MCDYPAVILKYDFLMLNFIAKWKNEFVVVKNYFFLQFIDVLSCFGIYAIDSDIRLLMKSNAMEPIDK